MKLVIAGNYSQYKRYLHDEGLTPAEVKYVNDPDMIRGYDKPEIILYGSWWENPAADEARRLRNVKN